jgi:hypothetical protein
MFQRIKFWWTTFRHRHIVLEAIVSLCLAYLVWMYTHSRSSDSTDFVQVPVQIQLAPGQRDNFAIEVQGQTRVNVTFAGPYSRIRELRRKIQRGSIQAVVAMTVPEERLHENSYGDVARVSVADISVPPGVTVELADDNANIPVTIHRVVERILPVRLEVTGDVRVSNITMEPSTVTVRGPKAILDRAAFIATQPCSLPMDREGTSEDEPQRRDQADLVTELEGRPIQTSPRFVQFRCRVTAKERLYDLHDVPVHFLCPAGFPLRPRFLDGRGGKVSVQLKGPPIEGQPPVLAFVDLSAGNYSRGRNLEPIRLQLPKDFQLVQNATPLVAFTLDEPGQESGVRIQETGSGPR